MAFNEFYVDPSIAGNSGTGTIGDPYGDVQYALNTETAGTTGNLMHVKGGTSEVLAAGLDFTTFGAPSDSNPFAMRGYTSTAGDGGIGTIDGAGTYGIFASSALDWIILIDMHFTNCGSADVIDLDNNIYLINCEVDGTAGDGIDIDNDGLVLNCYVHNCGAIGITTFGSKVSDCVLENGTNDFGTAVSTSGGIVQNCVISVDGSSDGMFTNNGDSSVFKNNTIYSAGGTGEGINIGAGAQGVVIENNYIEGFSGSGGDGVLTASGSIILWYRGNRFYNNATHETLGGVVLEDTDNSVVGSSALTNPGSGDFSVGTDLKAGAYPTTFKGISTNQFMDIGAAQREEPAGGGGASPIFGGAIIR